MKEKMISFLKSIGISDYESFDMDFEMVSRNRFDRNLIDMFIKKETPWNYDLLKRFQDGLETIHTYKYSVRFTYGENPKADNVIELYKEWYRSIYHFPTETFIKKENDDTVVFVFSDVSELNAEIYDIQEFSEFLKFISYDFITLKNEISEPDVVVQEQVKEDAPVIETPDSEVIEQKVETIEEVKTEEVAETQEVEPAKDNEVDPIDSNEIKKQIDDDQQKLTEAAEKAFLNQMIQNKIIMEKERERNRINRRGNYQFVEKIDDLVIEQDKVDFNGFIYKMEVVERGESKRVNLGVADALGGAIHVNFYQGRSIPAEIVSKLGKNVNIRIRGAIYFDEFSKANQIKAHLIDILPPDEIVPEEFVENRVELHLHSTMSTQDGVGEMIDYAKYAKALGHKVMAITDHGCVQGFPDAQAAAKATGIKMLYGCEFYSFDDQIRYIYNPNDKILNKSSYVVFDLETTGLSARYNKIIEFGAVKIVGGNITERLDILVNPLIHIPEKITGITNITDELVENEQTIDKVLPKILEFIGDSILVTHNAQFDVSFLNESLVEHGYEELTNGVIDTLALSRYSFPDSRNHRLGTLCKRLEVVYDEESAHRADYDAFVLAEVWQVLLERLTKANLKMQHKELASLVADKELIKHLRPQHLVALAKNKQGLKDLYQLVSISNIDYFASNPLIPKRIIDQFRENLLIGSACFNGEVFETARYYNRNRLINTCKYFDYIEVQPPENYSYLVNMGELTNEEVEQYIKDIIKAGKAAGKIVVATGDAHYVTPKQKKFRDVYISAPQVGKINHPLNSYARAKMAHFENPDQHYRTTKEMLDAFNFLGEDLAKEIVITNTNLIADEIESLVPVPNDHLYTPHFDNVENILKDLCYTTAHKLYGKELPELIQKRLDTELNGIIGNGYAVIYYIAHRLVKKSNEDGYIVGSRGSVGSSFVATMSGITEVNPLPPHYRCPHCHHLEWTSDEHPEIKSGFDLPAKKCPICGEDMVSDGQNIPFETFLGFSADKVPDIDLNFPGDYQARAHEYTKVLLGKDNVFRAGTIGTVEEKTAFGFARGYVERLGLDPNTYPKAKLEYLSSGCIGVKRTTGQHPGGIVVIPSNNVVYDFTPVQWPADEVGSAWKTTHFDFHSIHDTILKLDMLGHVDPVALKMMCDLTHIPIDQIPLNDPEVYKIFSTPEPLKMHGNYLKQETGAMAIPEFGTNFVRGILEKTRPSTFADLVIISGLSHGTDVWTGNAEKLILDKVATLRDVIGCRDDIMSYLIGKGLPKDRSFKIMESVRKGKGLKTEDIEMMLANNVPQYYIDSCKKIKYLFPKGHAVAYVTMAIRVGYFKVHYPLEFYATFFSVRSDQYDIIPMIKGEEAIIARLEELKNKEKNTGIKMSTKEEDQVKTLQIAIEMVQRGYKFSNIDLYRSDYKNFVVDHENKCLIPPFITIDGLGANNAITVCQEREKRPFSSKEDLLHRTKLSGTNVNDLAALGVLKDLPESDQLSLFDF